MTEAEKRGYFIGVGSNVEPDKNAPALLECLLAEFQQLTLSRLCYTQPVGLFSENIFVNFVIYLESCKSPQQIKYYCNEVEASFGRDRSHPERKRLDRKADLDIIYSSPLPVDVSLQSEQLSDEAFMQPMLQELMDFLAGRVVPAPSFKCLVCSVQGSILGDMPTTINLEGGACHVGIAQDG